MTQTQLPIDAVLPQVIVALSQTGRCVLQAPPGAGKTTRVPLAVLDSGIVAGKILLLEPRRLATRAAADRMASTLGETVGQTVGYRMRGDTKVSTATRIEVITESILTRMIQSDPDLPGVSAILFDEFHERSLATDLGLALAWEVRGALRDDLLICVMSATLDADPVAALLDNAPVVTSDGRAFAVDIRHLPRPLPAKARFDQALADLVVQAVAQTDGGVLVFLPGEAEIRNVHARLADRLPPECTIRPLLGALPFADQQKAIRPDPDPIKRKIVLATAIAETSLTIQDVRVVVDGGKARRARYDPNLGLSRLVTDPVSRAEATQRTGRAGRVAPGVCYRLWAKAEEGALPAFAPAEIEIADLAPLALDLAQWGTGPADLALLTQPAPGPWAAALTLMDQLGATDRGTLTDHGKRLAAMPLHPRLAQMMVRAGPAAAAIAAVLSDRDILTQRTVDLSPALKAVAGDRSVPLRDPGAIKRIRAERDRLAKLATGVANLTPAQCLALAFPDRIALRRPGDTPRYLLSGGMGAVMDAEDPLAQDRLLVIADMGNPRAKAPEPTIRRALAISEAELRDIAGDQIAWHRSCTWSKRDRKVIARMDERLGAIALKSQTWKDAPADALATAMIEGVRQLGLRLPPTARRLQARVAVAQAGALDLPDMSDGALLDGLTDWLMPFVAGITSEAAWKDFDPMPALEHHLGWDAMRALKAAVPGYFTTPLNRKIAIDYSGDTPEITLRLQELFGQITHPMVGGQPLKVTLLSPAQRPIQTTMDIPGFWAGSYADVRKDMRARYPKHPWPEDPTQADPTLRAKPRK
ncbi:MAG: ATP-dependent helicase HrpB [Pseudomonadota bacterium]